MHIKKKCFELSFTVQFMWVSEKDFVYLYISDCSLSLPDVCVNVLLHLDGYESAINISSTGICLSCQIKNR